MSFSFPSATIRTLDALDAEVFFTHTAGNGEVVAHVRDKASKQIIARGRGDDEGTALQEAITAAKGEGPMLRPHEMAAELKGARATIADLRARLGEAPAEPVEPEPQEAADPEPERAKSIFDALDTGQLRTMVRARGTAPGSDWSREKLIETLEEIEAENPSTV